MNDELKALGSVRTRGLVLLLFVALAGGAAGGALDRLWMARRADAEGRTSGWATVRTEPRGGEQRLELRPGVERIERRAAGEERGTEGVEIPYALRSVDLTEAQKEKIRAITLRFRPVAESLMRSVRPRIAEMDFRMREEAMCVLTPKQRDDWVAWRRREHMNVEEGGAMLKLVTTNMCPPGTSTTP